MRAAAQFAGPIIEGNDPNQVAVLLVEECDGASCDRLLERKLLHPALQVRADFVIEQAKDAIDLVGSQRTRKTKIKGCRVLVNRRPGLRRLVAQHVAKGAMQQVRGRVMTGDRLTALSIHRGAHPIAGLEPIGRRGDPVTNRLTLWLHVDDDDLRAVPGQPAGIGRLPASLRIKRRLFEEHIGLPRVAGDREDVGDGSVHVEPVIADKARRSARQRRRESAGCHTAALPLTLHQCRDRGHVDGDPLFSGQLGGEFDRETKGVVQVEDLLRGQRLPIDQPLEALHTLPQRDAEALLLRSHHIRYLADLLTRLGVDIAQESDHDWHPRR